MTTVDDIVAHRFSNAQYALRPLSTIRQLYRDMPDAIERTSEVAGRCHFSLDQLRYEYPSESAPNGMKPIEYLKRLVLAGAQKRYDNAVPEKVLQMLRHDIISSRISSTKPTF